MRKEDTYTLLGTLSLVPRFKQMPPNHEKPQNKKGSYFRNYLIQRAENGTQTRDPQLGRLVLYFGNEKLRFPLLRLSYSLFCTCKNAFIFSYGLNVGLNIYLFKAD
ncbi:hypothetical protein DWW57_12830 [Odoribacter splanchnicus]|uniref:Uncharacterized protein n=1 Tax=Odoribacter splanchnicus TaxID=28118 RepID=A0A412TN89_9BACT|nr:hypothetical protein DWW57_12830 [Odoribacter splanchnicus]